MYQGLALPNFPLIALAEKASFLVGNWGFQGQAQSDALAMAYNNFLVEVGLYGSPLDWNYGDYGHLSMEDTWFWNLWQLRDTFNAMLTFCAEDQVRGVQEGNRPLMSEFFQVGYRGSNLAVLNIVQRHQNLLHLSDILKCDGITLDEFVVSEYAERLQGHVFPREEPIALDLRLWREAVHQLCAGTSILLVALGCFLQPAHIACQWFTTVDATMLYQTGGDPDAPMYNVYEQREGLRTRHGSRFLLISSKVGVHPGMHYASIEMLGPTSAGVHSKAPFLEPLEPPGTFHGQLAAFGNPSLWENLSVDGDGSWLWVGVIGGSLCIAHDGSYYMAEESTNLCSAGLVIFCRVS